MENGKSSCKRECSPPLGMRPRTGHGRIEPCRLAMNGTFLGRGRHYLSIEAVPRGQAGPASDRPPGDFAMTRSAVRRTVATFLFLLLSLTALAAAAPLRSVTGPKARPA